MTATVDDLGPSSGFAHERVPESEQGSGWRMFFIVGGSLCGLPVFILGAQISSALGFQRAAAAVFAGGLIMGLMGGISAYAGSRTRMSLAMLSDQAFGTTGARFVKLMIALALVGWVGVGISVLGATASTSIQAMSGRVIQPAFISVPVSILIAYVAIKGARGLEWLGKVLIPLVVVILGASVWLTADGFSELSGGTGTGNLTFGGAISAMVGSYIVGIVVQPDYGRFVRRPMAAALGTGTALSLVFPIVLLASSVASIALAKSDLIAAMIVLGFGLPALAVLLMGAWIDASLSLYSGALSLANQFPRFRFALIVIAVAVLGVILSLLHAEEAFIPFLLFLGIALPPVATVQIAEALWVRQTAFLSDDAPAPPAIRLHAVIAWFAGSLVGGLTDHQIWQLSGIPSIDSILVSAAVIVVYRLAQRERVGPAEARIESLQNE